MLQPGCSRLQCRLALHMLQLEPTRLWRSRAPSLAALEWPLASSMCLKPYETRASAWTPLQWAGTPPPAPSSMTSPKTSSAKSTPKLTGQALLTLRSRNSCIAVCLHNTKHVLLAAQETLMMATQSSKIQLVLLLLEAAPCLPTSPPLPPSTCTPPFRH